VRVEHTTGDKQQVHGGSSPDVEVNKLFRADFFGERALLTDEPRGATVVVVGDTPLRCLTLTREVFTEYLGPLQVRLFSMAAFRRHVGVWTDSARKRPCDSMRRSHHA
jgi:CRP-like cAMP-binding protein